MCKYTDTKELHSIRGKTTRGKNKNIFGQASSVLLR